MDELGLGSGDPGATARDDFQWWVKTSFGHVIFFLVLSFQLLGCRSILHVPLVQGVP